MLPGQEPIKGVELIYNRYVNAARENGREISEEENQKLAQQYNEVIQSYFADGTKEANVVDLYNDIANVLGADNQETLDVLAKTMLEVSGVDGNQGTVSIDELLMDANEIVKPPVGSGIQPTTAEAPIPPTPRAAQE